jgi:vacuolar protein-sorting-associated protein 4
MGQETKAVEVYEEVIARCVDALVSHRCPVNDDEDVERKDATQMLQNLNLCIMQTKPDLTWDSVIGNDVAKNALFDALILANRYAKECDEQIIRPWDGVLLYGVPGCGKTELAFLAASIAKAVFFCVRTSDLRSMWAGRSERYVRLLFQKAREHKFSVIFFDEIDALVQARSKNGSHGSDGILTELLNEMSHKQNNSTSRVVVVGATNVPASIDKAILRRFQKRIHVRMPLPEERVQIFFQKMSKMNLKITDKQRTAFGRMTEG